MTNVEKAKELASSERISFDELNESYCNGIEYGAIEMAEWKDKEFSTENYKYYDPAKRMTREEAISSPQPVCVLTDADGQPQGVLVQALGERFVIEPKDFNGGEKMIWDDAMAVLKKAGKTTFNKQQAYIILFLLENINAAICSIGGDEFTGNHWAATEYGSRFAWYVYFGSGNFGYKCNAFVVRAITNL